MYKLPCDIISEWLKRGYITDTESIENEQQYISFIEQAKDSILDYCNIPLKANMPDGLFFAWVETAWLTSNSTISNEGSGAIKSISEGDTSISFDVSQKSKVYADYTTILNRFRRFP